MVQIGLRGSGYSEDDYAFGSAHGIRSIMFEEMYDQGIAVALTEMDRLRREKCTASSTRDASPSAFGASPSRRATTPGCLAVSAYAFVMSALVRRAFGPSFHFTPSASRPRFAAQ